MRRARAAQLTLMEWPGPVASPTRPLLLGAASSCWRAPVHPYVGSPGSVSLAANLELADHIQQLQAEDLQAMWPAFRRSQNLLGGASDALTDVSDLRSAARCSPANPADDCQPRDIAGALGRAPRQLQATAADSMKNVRIIGWSTPLA